MQTIPSLDAYLRMLSEVEKTPESSVWISYDREADVMYVNFRKPSVAADSELTDDDIIVCYDAAEEVIGFTVLHASQR